jgi:photosystem II stability/assembly factor-like uncharacterized protein
MSGDRELVLMIGTRKGAFIARSDAARTSWDFKGPFFKGVEVNHLTYVPERNLLMAAVGTAWFGPSVRLSRDMGETWTEPEVGVRFAEGRGHSVARVWTVENAGGVLYAGVDPAALFRSSDGGITWEEVSTLTDHPTREKWFPGAGGLMVHSICPDLHDPARLYVGISAAGTFRSDDGGATWVPKNNGVRTDFLPDKLPPVGQCVHHLERHSSAPGVLYQQNHCGVYRTENGGDDWIDISDGLPARFGFPLAVLPHDGDTIYVVPEEGAEARVTPEGAFRVFRSRNRGASWQPLTDGLPQRNAWQHVFRMAMCVDPLDSPGVYVGTQGGQLFGSRDAGDHWTMVFDWLPPIYSLEVALI